MTQPAVSGSQGTREKIYRLFRAHFDRAEKTQRWSVRDGIPWDRCAPALDPALADAVETTFMIELLVPDYESKLIPRLRANRGVAWMLFNWGYEESKHSMALGDWLVRSGRRSTQQLNDLIRDALRHEWEPPHDDPRALLGYLMIQELAAWLHCNNLRAAVNGRCPALDRVLELIALDERAHHDFFRRVVEVYLGEDREETLEQLRRAVTAFRVPALHLFADGPRRVQALKDLGIFDEDRFLDGVCEPLLAELEAGATGSR